MGAQRKIRGDANARPARRVKRELLKIDGKSIEVILRTNPRARRFIVKVDPSSGELSVRPKRITIRDTSSRWGSCSSARSLSFSWRLILAPPAVLEYVVAHEVAHLRELNHKPRFWRLVETLVPDIEKSQAWLSTQGAMLHRYAPRTRPVD